MTVISWKPGILEMLEEEVVESPTTLKIRESKSIEHTYGDLGFKLRKFFLYLLVNVDSNITVKDFTERYLTFLESRPVKTLYWDYVVTNIYDRIAGTQEYNAIVLRKLAGIVHLNGEF